MSINEFTFSVDDFKNPKVLNDAEAISTLLVRLLLLEPGTIQSHPEAGIGIHSKYRFGTEGIESELQANFQKQIQKYLPQFQGVKVAVKEKDHCIMIGVEIQDTLYAIQYDEISTIITANYTKLYNL